MASKKRSVSRHQSLSSSRKADLLFSRKLVQLHIVYNMPPFEDINPYFIRYVEKAAIEFGYNIGEPEFQQILSGWNRQASALLEDEDDVGRIMIMTVIWLTMKKQDWLAKCFRT